MIAGIVAVIASTSSTGSGASGDRGGRERHHEVLLFFGVSGVGVVRRWFHLWFSSYVLGLRVPNVSLTVENIADFVSAYIIGNLLQMAFRFWPSGAGCSLDEVGREPDRALESTLTAGGIAEAIEDEFEVWRPAAAW